MKRTWVILPATLLLAGVVLGREALARSLRGSQHAAPAATRDSVVRAPGFSEINMRDEQIRVWGTALLADSASALVLGQLAALHLQRAREGGGHADYLKAEALARRSLTLRTQRNGKAAVILVSVLLAQHRFTEAHEVATALVQREPGIAQYQSLLGEVSMEVGDYATSGRMFDSVWTERAHLSNAPRLARWLELNNHIREARRILVDARNDAVARRDVATETKAWFELRLGDFELRANRPRAAERSFRAGLAIEPDDPRLLAAMARLAASRRDHTNVIEWGARAIAVQLDPSTLGLMGDAYRALGDTVREAEYFRALEVAVTAQPGPFHRAWSLYLLDHNLQVAQVLARAQDELRERKDIYGYDLLAWALYKSGRVAEARVAMQQALQLNTPDPLLLRHAGEIGVTATYAVEDR